MLHEQSSGEAASGPESLSSMDMNVLPPVVMFSTASVRAAIPRRICSQMSRSAVGRSVCGSRACRCRTAAPASAAPTACSTIASGVTGRYGDMVGVCVPPVMAQVTIVMSSPRIATLLFGVFQTAADAEHLPRDGSPGRAAKEDHEIRNLLRFDHG